MTTGEIVAENVRCGVERETTFAAGPLAGRVPDVCRAYAPTVLCTSRVAGTLAPTTLIASSVATTQRVSAL
jgi:hypothetical protein